MSHAQGLPTGCTPLGQQGGCALWRVDLDVEPAPSDALLSPAEQRRAQRFAFARDRRRYTQGRSVLRQLLGQRLGVAPAALQLHEGPQGKPYLADAPELPFNVSHSKGVGLIGIALEGTAALPIGVDVETCQFAPDFEIMAETILTAQEQQALHALPAGQRCEALLFAWTRKEACVKAIGTGLNIPPNSFDTGFAGNGQIHIADHGTTHVLRLQTLAAGADVIASLAHLT